MSVEYVAKQKCFGNLDIQFEMSNVSRNINKPTRLGDYERGTPKLRTLTPNMIKGNIGRNIFPYNPTAEFSKALVKQYIKEYSVKGTSMTEDDVIYSRKFWRWLITIDEREAVDKESKDILGCKTASPAWIKELVDMIFNPIDSKGTRKNAVIRTTNRDNKARLYTVIGVEPFEPTRDEKIEVVAEDPIQSRLKAQIKKEEDVLDDLRKKEKKRVNEEIEAQQEKDAKKEIDAQKKKIDSAKIQLENYNFRIDDIIKNKKIPKNLRYDYTLRLKLIVVPEGEKLSTTDHLRAVCRNRRGKIHRLFAVVFNPSSPEAKRVAAAKKEADEAAKKKEADEAAKKKEEAKRVAAAKTKEAESSNKKKGKKIPRLKERILLAIQEKAKQKAAEAAIIARQAAESATKAAESATKAADAALKQANIAKDNQMKQLESKAIAESLKTYQLEKMMRRAKHKKNLERALHESLRDNQQSQIGGRRTRRRHHRKKRRTRQRKARRTSHRRIRRRSRRKPSAKGFGIQRKSTRRRLRA